MKIGWQAYTTFIAYIWENSCGLNNFVYHETGKSGTIIVEHVASHPCPTSTSRNLRGPAS